MINSIRHVGFVVRDINASLLFYSEILGLEVHSRKIEEGSYIDKLTGIEHAKVEWVKLAIPSGGLIELLQYHFSPDPVSHTNPTPSPSNKIGCSHIALTVGNLTDLYSKLIKNGYTCKSMPLISPDRKVKLLYCHDPDGAILELIEDL